MPVERRGRTLIVFRTKEGEPLEQETFHYGKGGGARIWPFPESLSPAGETGPQGQATEPTALPAARWPIAVLSVACYGAGLLARTSRQLLVNALWREIIGEPDAGKPHVRFDEEALPIMGLSPIRSNRMRWGVVVEGHCQ